MLLHMFVPMNKEFPHTHNHASIDHYWANIRSWKLYPKEHLAQGQEAGRNQGHTLMGIGLAGTLCQMVWIQGDDLFAADQNRLLAVTRYGARYDSGMSVPYTPYHNSGVTQPHIAPKGRGEQYDPNSGWLRPTQYGSLLFLTAHTLEK